MNDGHLLVGYHGCDITTRDDLIAGRTSPKSSQNKYDWLGPGFYLFEGDAARAQAFAEAAAAEPQKMFTAVPIKTPAVVGCIVELRQCLDMTTQRGLLEFEEAYSAFQDGYDPASQEPMPVNRAANDQDSEVLLRHLDNAVFTFIHSIRDTESALHYQAVRGAFRQGDEIAPNSGFHRKSHVQIALRDFSCVVGWFLPQVQPPTQLLDEMAYNKAKTALGTVKKPRVKAAIAQSSDRAM